MKPKAKISKLKMGLPTIFLFCFLFFFAGLFVSTLLFQDLGDVRSRSTGRILEESVAKEYVALEHGKTGEAHVESIPFQFLWKGLCIKRKSQYSSDLDPLKYFGERKTHIEKIKYSMSKWELDVLSWRPRAVYFPNFTSAEVCEHIINMAKSKLQPSKLALRKGESAESTKGTRTSSGTFISASEDKTGILELIERKIARVTMIPRAHGEAFNILRYEIGQKYDSHYDAFNPAEYGPQQSQRMASFLLYLSNVEAGGETMFPFEDGMNIGTGYDYKKCIGLKVKPRQGDGLLFYSLLPNGEIDKASLHGSCPVIEGEKWVATKWIRDRGQ